MIHYIHSMCTSMRAHTSAICGMYAKWITTAFWLVKRDHQQRLTEDCGTCVCRYLLKHIHTHLSGGSARTHGRFSPPPAISFFPSLKASSLCPLSLLSSLLCTHHQPNYFLSSPYPQLYLFIYFIYTQPFSTMGTQSNTHHSLLFIFTTNL